VNPLKHLKFTCIVLLICLAYLKPAPLQVAQAIPPGPNAVSGGGPDPVRVYLPLIVHPSLAPFLKWKNGGCYIDWCETGWYSSPVVVDVNGDGKNEVIASGSSLFALDGDTGALIWRKGSYVNRTWSGVVLADIDLDGKPEILIAQKTSRVAAYNLDGSLKWEVWPTGDKLEEFRGITVADLDNNHSSLEVIVTRGIPGPLNTYVLDAAGNLLKGQKWPQMSDGSGKAWGAYNTNQAVGDLRPDLPGLEVVVPGDNMYISAYDKNGAPLAANGAAFPNMTWGAVSVWENPQTELNQTGKCNGARDQSYRANFKDGPAVITDVNNDGVREVVVVGNMYDCSIKPYVSRFAAPFIFNADRSRFNSGGYDWRTVPIDTGAPLSEDYNVMATYEPNPVVADIDGDGNKEILYASYDGRMHVFWLDKTEHASWPYSVYQPSEGVMRFASEPALADLDNDGKAEVIFTSWVQKSTTLTGKLHILRWDGVPIYELNLPNSFKPGWNGAIAAPTLAKVGSSNNLAVIVNTTKSGVAVYELPGTANARILWGTGRGDFARTGTK
jgi:hypothetical protein